MQQTDLRTHPFQLPHTQKGPADWESESESWESESDVWKSDSESWESKNDLRAHPFQLPHTQKGSESESETVKAIV